MMPAFPFPAPPSRAEMIADIQGHIERLEKIAVTAAAFLRAHYPSGTDYVGPLVEAWLNFQTFPHRRQMELISKGPEQGYGYGYPTQATPETLIRLIESRDKLEQQIQNIKTASEKIGDTVPGMGEMLEATALPMMESQLESINHQISMVQQQLESQTPKGEGENDA